MFCCNNCRHVIQQDQDATVIQLFHFLKPLRQRQNTTDMDLSTLLLVNSTRESYFIAQNVTGSNSNNGNSTSCFIFFLQALPNKERFKILCIRNFEVLKYFIVLIVVTVKNNIRFHWYQIVHLKQTCISHEHILLQRSCSECNLSSTS